MSAQVSSAGRHTQRRCIYDDIVLLNNIFVNLIVLNKIFCLIFISGNNQKLNGQFIKNVLNRF